MDQNVLWPAILAGGSLLGLLLALAAWPRPEGGPGLFANALGGEPPPVAAAPPLVPWRLLLAPGAALLAYLLSRGGQVWGRLPWQLPEQWPPQAEALLLGFLLGALCALPALWCHRQSASWHGGRESCENTRVALGCFALPALSAALYWMGGQPFHALLGSGLGWLCQWAMEPGKFTANNRPGKEPLLPLAWSAVLAVAAARDAGPLAVPGQPHSWSLLVWVLVVGSIAGAYGWETMLGPAKNRARRALALAGCLLAGGALPLAAVLGGGAVFVKALVCWALGLLAACFWYVEEGQAPATQARSLALLLAASLVAHLQLQTLGVALVVLGAWVLLPAPQGPTGQEQHSSHPWGAPELLAGAAGILLFRCLSTLHGDLFGRTAPEDFYILVGLLLGACGAQLFSARPGAETAGAPGPWLGLPLAFGLLTVLLGERVVPGLLLGLLISALAGGQFCEAPGTEGEGGKSAAGRRDVLGSALPIWCAAWLLLTLEPLLALGEMTRRDKIGLLLAGGGLLAMMQLTALVAGRRLHRRGEEKVS